MRHDCVLALLFVHGDPRRGGNQPLKVVPKHALPEVAQVAKESTDLAGAMIVVDVEAWGLLAAPLSSPFVPLILRRAFTDPALAALLLEQFVVELPLPLSREVG